MAEFMLEADVIFSSAGRTMYEIAMIGTPAIIISQNYRELTHLFGHNYNGFINLGIHHEAREDIIQQSLERLIRDEQLRQMMNNRMLQHDLKRGIERVLSIILIKRRRGLEVMKLVINEKKFYVRVRMYT